MRRETVSSKPWTLNTSWHTVVKVLFYIYYTQILIMLILMMKNNGSVFIGIKLSYGMIQALKVERIVFRTVTIITVITYIIK